jgi:hypothetical protein
MVALLRILIFLAGLAIVSAGIALIHVPSAVVFGGFSLCVLAVLMERASMRETGRPPTRDTKAAR